MSSWLNFTHIKTSVYHYIFGEKGIYFSILVRGAPLPAHTWANRAILHGDFFG